MKTLAAVVLLLCCVTTSQAGGQMWAIKGEVLSVVEKEGILVLCGENRSFGLQKPKEGTVVLIKGNFPKAADGDPINAQAYEAGTYKYASTAGAAKTVRAFQMR